jgi:signal transduction histidine kinase
MQDSGLPDSRLLARLLQAGVLVLDEDANLHYASPGACELLGAASDTELRAGWGDIGAQLRAGEWPQRLPDGASYYGRADLRMPGGMLAIRFELHETDGNGRPQRVMLIRQRERLLTADRALLLASEAQANRHVLIGLVHSAKGPLNNFNLTLALLAAAFARTDASATSPDRFARCNRYLEVLRTETTRLAHTLDEVNALASPHEPSREAIDACALLRDVARVLHHGATMREVELDLDAPQGVARLWGDPQLTRLALLAFTICMLDMTPADGRVALRLSAGDGPATAPTISIMTSRGPLPADLVAGLFRLTCTAESDYAAAITARMIIEAQGGDVALENNDSGPAGFLLRFPAHA